MRYFLIALILFCASPLYAEWSEPVWTDDCTITVQKDLKGRMTTWTETCFGPDGKQTSKRTDTYTYYEKGALETVNLKIYDAKAAVISDKTVLHKEDGSAPTVSVKPVGIDPVEVTK